MRGPPGREPRLSTPGGLSSPGGPRGKRRRRGGLASAPPSPGRLCIRAQLHRRLGPKPWQATEAETKEDREIVCEEVFCDLAGHVDASARGEPRQGLGVRPARVWG